MGNLDAKVLWAVVVVGTCATTATAQLKYPAEVKEVAKKEGDTTGKASAKISRQKDKGLIEAKLFVGKSGQFGVGYVKAKFVFEDKDGNTLHKTDVVGAQVGAKIPEGRAQKTEEHDLEVPLDVLNQTHKVVVVVLVRDTDWKNNDDLQKAFDDAFGKLKDLIK
jgi:hypothetical protein